MSGKHASAKITAQEISRRLGCSSVATGPERLGARKLALMREAGIRYMEISEFFSGRTHYNHNDTTQISEIKSECKKQGITISSVHGPNIPYDSFEEENRRAVVEELASAVKVAEDMGARMFVTHFGSTCTIKGHVEKSINELMELTRNNSMKILIENAKWKRLDPYVDYIRRAGTNRLGLAVDIGHAFDPDGVNTFTKKGRAYEAICQAGQIISHLHLHDIVNNKTDHYPPFEGDMQWVEIFLALWKTGYSGKFMFEAQPKLSVENTLKKVAGFPCDLISAYRGRNTNEI